MTVSISTLYKLVACYGCMVAKKHIVWFYRLQFRFGIIGIPESLIFLFERRHSRNIYKESCLAASEKGARIILLQTLF